MRCKNKIIFIGIFGFLFIAFFCKKTKFDSVFGKLKGINIQAGKKFNSANLSSDFVINLFSLNCKSCIEELPALKKLSKKLHEKKVPFFIIVEQNPESHGWDKTRASLPNYPEFIKEELGKLILQYNITIPVILLNDSSQNERLVSVFPTTLKIKQPNFSVGYKQEGSLAIISDSNKNKRFQNIIQMFLDR